MRWGVPSLDYGVSPFVLASAMGSAGGAGISGARAQSIAQRQIAAQERLLAAQLAQADQAQRRELLFTGSQLSQLPLYLTLAAVTALGITAIWAFRPLPPETPE
jgi:hypothetical protein